MTSVRILYLKSDASLDYIEGYFKPEVQEVDYVIFFKTFGVWLTVVFLHS
jgi:hypothetical protein